MKIIFEATSKWIYAITASLVVISCSYLSIGHIANAIIRFKSLNFENGEFQDDRYINFAMAFAASNQGINHLDPFNHTTPIFYQFTWSWFLGAISNLTGLHPWAIANFLYLLLIPFLAAGIISCSYTLIKNKWWALCVCITVFSFHPLIAAYPEAGFGAHAVILAFYRGTLGLYTDVASTVFGYIGLFAFIKAHEKNISNPSKGTLILSLLSLTACYAIHYLSALFFIVTMAMLCLTYAYDDHVKTAGAQSKLKKVWALLITALILWAIIGLMYSMRPPLSLLALVGVIVFVGYTIIERNLWRIATLLVPLSVPAVLIVFNLKVLADANLNSMSYDNRVRATDLSIPLLIQIEAFWPLIIAALLLFTTRIRDFSQKSAVVLLICSAAMVNNDLLGYNNHPYRFIVYSFPALVISAAIGLKYYCKAISEKKSYWRIISYITILAISSGVVTGIYKGTLISLPLQQVNSYSIDSNVKKWAAIIDDHKPKDGYVFVHPTIADSPHLACYTHAKFYRASPVSFTKEFDPSVYPTTSYAQLRDYIEDNKLPIELIVVPNDWLDEYTQRHVIVSTADASLLPAATDYIRYDTPIYSFTDHIKDATTHNLLDPDISKKQGSIYLHAPEFEWASIHYTNIPTRIDAVLNTGIKYTGIAGDGVAFSVLINGEEVAFQELINAKPFMLNIPLANYRGAVVDVIFRVSKKADHTSDWAYFENPRIVVRHVPQLD